MAAKKKERCARQIKSSFVSAKLLPLSWFSPENILALTTIYSSFRKMNSKARAQYQDTFSMVNWKALNRAQKKQHTLSNCGGCQVHYYAIHNFFPSGEAFKTRKLLKEALIESGVKTQSKAKPTQEAIKTAVKHIYSKVNGHFEKIFKISFAEAQTKVKELQLQKKKDAIEKKRQRRGRARQEKK